ncbi:Scr1 family TA system antitoxin-like transcriptional regulator [Streptomyces radicis]|uniref:Scr1 family TA system antitoxin-like transcriptional regulator n=1 Tax=Streptomyces radicis TaxID=1750517 RepID=UPI001601C787|nr:Scr1 family TA system antitoxin-like transcriptional regulator [Streptomyces radicis]
MGQTGGTLCAQLREEVTVRAEIVVWPNVTLQVLPFSVGAYRGGPFPFKVYRFPEPSEMQVVLLENHVSHTYLEDPSDIGFYADVFNHLRATALGELESKTLIEGIIAEASAERDRG